MLITHDLKIARQIEEKTVRPRIKPQTASNNQLKSMPHKGFALKELIVCVVLLFLLGAVLFPIILSTRVTSRRNMCLRRQQIMALAFSYYHEDFRQLPGYSNPLAINPSQKQQPTGWVYPLLPYIEVNTDEEIRKEEDPPYIDIIERNQTAESITPIVYAPTGIVYALFCPEALPEDQEQWFDYSSYVVNCGMADLPESKFDEQKTDEPIPPDWESNGIFQNQYLAQTNLSIIQYNFEELSKRNGRENTLLMSENIDAGPWTASTEAQVGFIWAGEKTSDENSPWGINEKIGKGDGSLKFARLSSYHPEGVNVMMASGATIFLSDQIDPTILKRQQTTEVSKARYPGTEDLIWPKVNLPSTLEE